AEVLGATGSGHPSEPGGRVGSDRPFGAWAHRPAAEPGAHRRGAELALHRRPHVVLGPSERTHAPVSSWFIPLRRAAAPACRELGAGPGYSIIRPGGHARFVCGASSVSAPPAGSTGTGSVFGPFVW